MSEYLSDLLRNINDSIAENFLFGELDYYAIYDASFILNLLGHVKLDNTNLQLGIYRIGEYHSGFYCAPYVHLNKLDGDYSPKLEEVPCKKTFLQKIGLSKSPKPEYKVSEDYDVNLSIDGIIPESMIDSIPSPLHHALISNWHGEGIWDVFLLDNLQYVLPTFGHGAYTVRKFITCNKDIQELPKEIVMKTLNLSPDLMPTVKYHEGGATITIHYFNKWEGLVKWVLNYYTFDDSLNPLYANRVMSPSDRYDVIIPYDCGIRF